jgi:hypothetical protein
MDRNKNGQVTQEEMQAVASATFDLEFRPDRPDVLGLQRWLCPGQLSLVPRRSLSLGVAFT